MEGGSSSAPEKAPEKAPRLRATLRRHGLVRRPAALRDFLFRQGLRFTEGNRVDVYADGANGLAAMLTAIESARDRVHLETYILRDDATGQRFLAALTERARAGVRVRLLYDAFGSISLDDSIFEPLRRLGGDVIAFNPLRLFYPRWLPRRRDHRKLLIVDGNIAFIGGLNIGDEYNAGLGAAGWRDTHLRVGGPAVRELEAVFLESWFRADGPELPWAYLLGAEPAHCGSVRCAVIPDGPVYRRRMLRDLVALGLRTAASDVRLTTPYFAPDRRVLRALMLAGRRGLQTEVLLAGETDHPVLRRAAHWYLPKLLAAGVRVWEHQSMMLHAKTCVFDQQWAIVGTSNLDRQSFEHSYEVNLVIEGGEIPAVLNRIFARDLQFSVPIDEQRLADRGPLERFLDWLSALVLYAI